MRRKSLLEGQVDIIEIGKEQLFDILDFLDPDHINEKFEPLEQPYRYLSRICWSKNEQRIYGSKR